MSKSGSHRLSKRNRYLAWGAAGVVVAAGGAFAATSASATTAWPAQKTFTGRAFDACTAPSASAMKAWHTGFYGAAAVYVGGKNRGCTQANLTASWVRTVTAQGWKLVPLYVGAQPPCQTGTRNEKMTTANAAALGAIDGKDAVAKSAALGMKAGSAVYLDMEPYDIKNASCNKAVLSYVRAFDKALHDKTYRAGFYGFSSSSAAAIATATDRTDLPGNLWYAKWDNVNTTTSDWPWNKALFTNHSRAHQYMVNSKETRGGYSLTVDRDAFDGPVAIVG
ncbi:glycoside hydrolase domain-containing protein [uncultured Streptomyces sp.]|uniref:glycoside hydrolase domain-containing protein n=1 Tax=uncultured Streptomyces sp. TaxID=174707 RepID=UPI00260C173C|nr:glycoside hydrolase domain-containing protein [uncultured Streptomyces sp.]